MVRDRMHAGEQQRMDRTGGFYPWTDRRDLGPTGVELIEGKEMPEKRAVREMPM